MFRLFGISLADVGLRGAADLVQTALKLPGQQLVVTANPEILVYARRHPTYQKLLAGAGLVVPDGFGVILASYLFREPLARGRVTGVDLVELLIAESGAKGYSLFFIGSASNDILQKATLYFLKKYTKINIVGYEKGPIFSKNHSQFPMLDTDNDKLLASIREKKPDVILVGFGHPKQEEWLSYYLPQLPVKVGIGVGGAFDYFAGTLPRAPRFMSAIGFEWLWRLFMEPRRLKRILTAILIFPVLALSDCIKGLFHVEQA